MIPSFVNVLRISIGVVAIMAFGNTVQCFLDHKFLGTRLYTTRPEYANGLVARLFGVWTLLAGVLRLSCAIDIYNKTLYHVTFCSFVLAVGHFVSEVFVYRTAALTVGVMAPLIVSSASLVLMLVGYRCLEESKGVGIAPDRKIKKSKRLD